MSPEEFRTYFVRLKVAVEEAAKKDLPMLVGNKAVQLFKRNFEEEGFFGQKWLEVKRRMQKAADGTATAKKGKAKKAKKKPQGAASRRPILTGSTGNLGRSIQMKENNGEVVVTSDLPYSAAHNYGTDNAGRGHRTRIPQRQFMGEHPKLSEELRATVTKHLVHLIRKP